ncbi:unnamed protein product, partial [Staurois parvus]
ALAAQPYIAAAGNHWVPAIDYPLAPVITDNHRRGGGLHCLLIVLLPVSLGTLLWIASSVLTVKHQHTVPQ